MKTQEAISILATAPRPMEHRDKYEEAVKMAVSALEKQIPIKIKMVEGFVECQRCHKYIRLPIIDHYSHCPECGQAVDFTEDK